MSKRTSFFLIILIIILLSLFKIWKIGIIRDENYTYRGKSSLNYRYARMISREGHIPEIDRMIEFPDGINTKHEILFLMESAIGFLYKIIPVSIPFHVFLVFFTSVLSSFIVIPVYLISFYISKDRLIGIFTILFAASSISLSRNIIDYEFFSLSFSVILILFHIYYLLRAISSGEKGAKNSEIISYSIISGSLLFTSLSMGIETQFYLILYSIVLSILSFRYSEIQTPFFINSFFVVLSCFLIPLMRSSYLIFSFPMLLIYSVFISIFTGDRKKWLIPVIFLVLSTIVLIFIHLNLINEPYLNQHIFKFIRIFIFKICNIFGISLNKEWSTLFLSMHLYMSPTPIYVLKTSGIIILTGLSCLIMGFTSWQKGSLSVIERILIILTALVLVLFPFLKIAEIFLTVFSALLIYLIINKYRKITLIVISVFLILNISLLLNYNRRVSDSDINYTLQVVKFLRHNSEKKSPILAGVKDIPIFLTYSNRPIVINPFIFSVKALDKIKNFEYSLYNSERSFYNFCSKNKVRYFVYNPEMLTSQGFHSPRFRTDNMVIARGSPVYSFHFAPENLSEFILIFSNPLYRVYEVHYSDIQPKPYRYEYLRMYDIELYNIEELGIK